jgi:hypothetical protein
LLVELAVFTPAAVVHKHEHNSADYDQVRNFWMVEVTLKLLLYLIIMKT